MPEQTENSTLSHDAVVITHCDQINDNYCITLKRPDGSTLKVLVPIENTVNRLNRKVANSKIPFGLNFVTEGHYC